MSNKKHGEPRGSIAFQTLAPDLALAVRVELRKQGINENRYADVMRVVREVEARRARRA